MAKSIVDSDGDDTPPKPNPYVRQQSREYTAEELADLERKARKEGKRDILLSQLVEQQTVTTRALDTISIRLAEGSKDIDNIESRQEKLEKRQNEIENESASRLKALNDVSLQAQQATSLIESHIKECKERKKIENDRWDKVEKSLDAQTKKVFNKNTDSLWDKIGVNVISTIIVAAIMGGLFAYFFLLKGDSNGQTNAGNDNQSESSSDR